MPDRPRVSVLMPTFKHATFIRRAIESLCAQTFQDWELVIVDDGSPDDTAEVVAPYLSDARVGYYRLERNRGLGVALNEAVSRARGDYIAYLPSDDVYYPEHLQKLVTVLDTHPNVYLAYGGLRWNYDTYAATLQGDHKVGQEAEALLNPPPIKKGGRLNNGNLLALVQVMHRRGHENAVQWTPRAVEESDRLEADYWRALVRRGAAFAYTGDITCEWVDHPDERHKIIASSQGGLSRFRQYYGLGRDEPLNWQPSYGPRTDERVRYAKFRVRRDLPLGDGLKILLVGELGFNPDRIMALEERGHKLYGTWMSQPEGWDTTGPLSFGNVEDIPFDHDWVERVRTVQPDVIYALLNWQAVPLIHDVFTVQKHRVGLPFVFHFKEGPFICQEKGTWPLLIRLLRESDGQVFINSECYEWFQLATDYALDPDRTLILDGDLPKADWFTDEWSPRLGDPDGEVHTVCAGRVIGIEPFTDLVRAGVHVHFYGDHFHQMMPNLIREGMPTGYMHLHPTVQPWEWVRELSQYDAAWLHVFDSRNGGDLRRANWDDLNLPARLGAYYAAGLPLILKDVGDSRTALKSLAQQYDVGVFFKNFTDLGEQLRDRQRVAQLNTNMRTARLEGAFDTYVDALVALFRQAIEGHRPVNRRLPVREQTGNG
ncbi:MAG: glycosyltransferase family 2 protein [Chloroflexi bacterium]|nr:glycosyltransferase family 2 protein [Chloroflexota bacterium]